ncbi:cytochrome c oxidase assembly protein [Protomyces lactucae-debilis]|uniref:Cytochrome c oxidase assembly protein n=1 Tax=Protomyces lactucae-debilis TaxID=2754530 RepID=A0A1Y2FUE3_PROLT|nr:cytochrome c oxidase assembly protein [Protomyces lactucae-debilis]ORY86914.1 cytochrome c oxidase assembly protein [Protomyces lactucae-debilis]
MSRTAKATLGFVSLCTVATIYFVHYSQQADKDLMHMGVVRDEERQKQRKERTLELERQQALEAALKQSQSVRQT